MARESGWNEDGTEYTEVAEMTPDDWTFLRNYLVPQETDEPITEPADGQ